MTKLIGILKNKVLIYIVSRYLVYGMQFISLIILADKLGPNNYGRWGFIIMLISYLNLINLGIPSSVNVVIVQNKNNIDYKKEVIVSSFILNGILIIGLIVLALIYLLTGANLFYKYDIGSLFYGILFIGAFQYVNNTLMNVFRAENKLFVVALYQSAVPMTVFTIAIFAPLDKLITTLVIGYIVAHFISSIIFLIYGRNYWGGKPSFECAKYIFNKGFFLFVYNAGFYLILTTNSSLVSWRYSVGQYGIYSFSYTLGHSILLLLEAFIFIVFPKVIDKFYSGDNATINKTITAVRANYIVLSHGLMYVAFIFFPLLIKIFPRFSEQTTTLYLMMLAIILSVNAFGYNTYLIAQNKEKTCACISTCTLLINCIIGYSLCRYIVVPYYMMTISIMISYLFFAYACSWFAHKNMKKKSTLISFINSIMPLSLLCPFILTVFIVMINKPYLMLFPLFIFIIMNKRELLEIISTIKAIINKPNIVDINK